MIIIMNAEYTKTSSIKYTSMLVQLPAYKTGNR